MIAVRHKFAKHQVDLRTEILIVGTFNPETANNEADFFYGRNRNYLWRLLPTAFGKTDLRGASVQEKFDFISQNKIDFIDLIEEIRVEEGQEANYFDGYIDCKVVLWKNVIATIDILPNIKKVCFTRRTFSDIPNMKKKLNEIQQHCDKKGIDFKALTTPARFYRQDKQAEWTNFFFNGGR